MRHIAPLGTLLCALLHSSVALAACEDLASLKLDGAHIISAAALAAGPMSFADANGKPATALLPAFCRVKAVADPGTGFEVWLPEHGWNQQFLSVGSGGFGGQVQLAALAEALLGAYAATSNDTGHTSEDKGWMGDARKVRLWGHDATHITTAPAKAIVAAFYARPAAHAYFSGCSTGGAQAMTEAQSFPGDYDGIVAGAPGMSYAHLMLSFLWGKQVASAYPDSKLGPAQLLVLHKAVLAQCDGLDGAADGLLENPRACRFEPRTLLCQAGAEETSCLTPHQVETVQALHEGPRNPRTGEQIYPGFEYGSEASDQEPPVNAYSYGWLAIQGPLADIFAIPLLRQMVYHDPAWDARNFDWDKDVAEIDRRIAADITATNPDLRAFRAAGGKLLMYQGWGDPLNGQSLPISYREQVKSASGADVDSFLRVFMVPGMSHCGRGPGPNTFDALGAVRSWVETGTPPERLVASKPADQGAVAMTRPLCPYPAVAHWNGKGSLNDEKNFTCSSEP